MTLLIVRGLLLLTSIILICYTFSTPGQQNWQPVLGGMAGMTSMTLAAFDRRNNQ